MLCILLKMIRFIPLGLVDLIGKYCTLESLPIQLRIHVLQIRSYTIKNEFNSKTLESFIGCDLTSSGQWLMNKFINYFSLRR